MQSLSPCPSNGTSCVVPQLEFEVGSSGFSSSKRREMRWGLVDNCVHYPSFGLFVVSSTSRSTRCKSSSGRSEFHVKGGFLSYCSKVEFGCFTEPKKRFCGSFGALASTLEQQEVVDEFHSVELRLDDGFSGKNGFSGKKIDGDVSCYKLDNLEDGDGNSGGEEIKKLEFGSEEEIGGEMVGRVNFRALAQSLYLAKTADDVEEVLKDKGDLPLQGHVSMIRSLGKVKKMEPALAIVEWLKRKKETGSNNGPNVFVYNSLLGVVKQCELYEQTEKIMNDMIQEGLVPNVVTYTTLMFMYVKQGQPAKALDILEEMREKGLTPDAASYSTAMLAYQRMGDGIGAVNFFVEIKKKYLKGEMGEDADEDWEKGFFKLQNFILRICYELMHQWILRKENLNTNVLNLLKNMDKARLQLSQEDYEHLVWACTRSEHFVVVKELYIRIRETYGEISLSVCNRVIWLMVKAKEGWGLEIYQDLLHKGPKPDNRTYELVLSLCTDLLHEAKNKGLWKQCVRLIDLMEDKGLKPRISHWNAVLIACSKRDTSAAAQIFRRMVDQGKKPSIVSYGALLNSLKRGKRHDEAVRVWEHMRKVNVKPDVFAYTIIASVLAAQGKFVQVDAIIHEMVSSGIKPTVVTYNAIISACAHNGMSVTAYEWFHRMKDHNLSPNEISYEIIIEALAKDGKPAVAYELYLSAKSKGLNLSAKPYDAVVNSSQAHGAAIDTDSLGPRPPEKKKW